MGKAFPKKRRKSKRKMQANNAEPSRKRRRDLTLAAKVGARARDIRLEKGLSLVQLHARGAPTPSHMSEIERGNVDFDVDTILCIAMALKVRPWQLLTDDEMFSFDEAEAKRILFVLPDVERDEPQKSPERAKPWHWKKAQRGGAL
jgi:transcriptional regulator with XRE-family HTH domain